MIVLRDLLWIMSRVWNARSWFVSVHDTGYGFTDMRWIDLVFCLSVLFVWAGDGALSDGSLLFMISGAFLSGREGWHAWYVFSLEWARKKLASTCTLYYFRDTVSFSEVRNASQ